MEKNLTNLKNLETFGGVPVKKTPCTFNTSDSIQDNISPQ